MGSSPLTTKHTKLAELLENTVLILVCSLGLLVPFSLDRNIDLQGFVLLITGCLAWVAVIIRKDAPRTRLSIISYVLLAIYITTCFISLAAHFGQQSILGAPLERLGALGLIACVGCGLALRSVDIRRLTKWLYVTIILIALSAIPYALIMSHSLARPGGVFAQADILAVFMGCGLLLGVSLWRNTKQYHRFLIASQLLLFAILCLTQTRAVFGILAVVFIVIILRAQLEWQKRAVLCAALSLIIIGGAVFSSISSNRITNLGYFNESVTYRLNLQESGFKATFEQPLLGYGAGSIENALSCKTLTDKDLLESCNDGYYFSSSHNIFLDRALALGWIGGISYLLFVVICLYLGLRSKDSRIQIMTYCALLITAYYLTNVTSLALELLFIAMLLRVSRV